MFMQKLPMKTNHKSPTSWTASESLIALFPWYFNDILLCSLQSLLKLIADLALLRAKQQTALQTGKWPRTEKTYYLSYKHWL